MDVKLQPASNTMRNPASANRLFKQLGDLCQLVAQRVPAETEAARRHESIHEQAQTERSQTDQRTTRRYEEDKHRVESEYADLRRKVIGQFDADYRQTEAEYQQLRAKRLGELKAEEAQAQSVCKQNRWESAAVAEAVKNGATIEFRDAKAQQADQMARMTSIGLDASAALTARRQWRDYPDPEIPTPPSGEAAISHLGQLLGQARNQLQQLRVLSLPRLFEGAQPVGLFLLLCVPIVVPCALFVGTEGWPWVIASVGVALAVFGGLLFWLYRIARRQCTEAYLALKTTLLRAEATGPKALEAIEARYRQQVNDATEKQRQQSDEADAALKETLGRVAQGKEESLGRLDTSYPARLGEIARARDQELEEAQATYSQRLTEIHDRYRETSQGTVHRFSQMTRDADHAYQEEFNRLGSAWHAGLRQFESTLDEASTFCDARFPTWTADDWRRWKPATEIPSIFRIGHYPVLLENMPQGVPKDERLQPSRVAFDLPALLPFPERSLMMLKSSGQGTAEAVEVLQTSMLRILTAVPPGKIRFTVVDPVGLGENFAAFMHLADFHDKIVGARIWTEAGHIEQRLADLSEHMENVLQVYLRNEFATILEYNQFAGEMAEPYRVLVIANFPSGFSEKAAARLKSIVASGARCGVFTLMSIDTKLPMPRQFDLADLADNALIFSRRDGRFVTRHEPYGELPLVLESPPPADLFTRIVRAVGEVTQDADKVEVPFDCVAPEPESRWRQSAREGVDVPLGRAGAKKLQVLKLGSGTSQHVLVSGKTGSGKSTLWHALITNIALRYSPDEVQLYLIDFKKGVEFKAYAAGNLPHARVVAIESEREFGLSVLARLDQELKRRGDMFRALRVQDLKGYRDVEPEKPLPRILLVIDEFQELFVDDDRLAQDASLFLDRLVRQGRAFGIHVLLGSQTLAGAYSLARSTLGQMAVRIALQCSDTDAHLILSEDNTAARLLTRPGEAIYNDANGLYEGNHPFQVVWLPDHQRDDYLRDVARMASSADTPWPKPIVFEGNTPAEPAENPRLIELIEDDTWTKPPRAVAAWVGSPVAIKDATAATFVRQSGSNLLVVGHREESALGVMTMATIALAVQHPPIDDTNADAENPGPRFYLLDGMRPDAPHAGIWERLAGVFPHRVEHVTPRAAGAVVGHIAAELARREAGDIEEAPPIFLVIYHLSRFRELRRSEDDYGFSRGDDDKPANPAAQLTDILRSGPALGIHALLWCDSYNTVSRVLDRQVLRDIEMRIVFQMNPADSSNLVDTPIAAQLGVHRAVLNDEAHGTLEKFRPYGVPSHEWLDWVASQLAR